MKVWEGERIPIGTIVGYQIQWAAASPQWETVDEKTFYRSLHQPDALCFGRYIRVAVDREILTNEDGIRPLTPSDQAAAAQEND